MCVCAGCATHNQHPNQPTYQPDQKASTFKLHHVATTTRTTASDRRPMLCRKRSHSVESLTENKMLRVMCDLAKEARDAQCSKHAGHVMEYAAEGSNPHTSNRACYSHVCALP